MANQGIMHLAHTRGGRPFCNTRRSHMSTTLDDIGGWSRICVKCQNSKTYLHCMKVREKKAAEVQS